MKTQFAKISLNDSTIPVFEKVLVLQGFIRTTHSYTGFQMFDIWEHQDGTVYHVDQVVAAGNNYTASKRN